MYGAPLSFINVSGWSEDGDDGDPHCIINVVEVAVVFQFTRSLIKGLIMILSLSIYSSRLQQPPGLADFFLQVLFPICR